MYTRGQFCIIGKSTRKALRIYEEKGILLPAYIDEANGYRYYNHEQIADILTINELKKLGFSLEEIKEILTQHVSLTNFLEKRLENLADEIQESYRTKEQIETKLLQIKQGHEEKQENRYVVEQCSFELPHALSKAVTIRLEDIGSILSGLYATIGQLNLTAIGPHFVYYKDSKNKEEDAEIEVEIGIPIGLHAEEQKHHCMTIEKGRYLKTEHRNGFSNVGLAHAAIIDWASEHHITLTGRTIERYVSIHQVEVLYEVAEKML